jgi:ferric-dicitrate binding protein FerR (iron transport regulator)
MDDTLLYRYFENKTTDTESKYVTAWLDESENHLSYYFSLCRIYESALWLTEVEIPGEKYPQLLYVWRKINIEVVKIAAIIVLTIWGTQAILQSPILNPIAMQTVHAPAGQHAEVTLADGSKVWLNAGSELKFPTHFKDNSREVTLQGEGFFEVKANAEQPFIVSTEQYKVRALGTSFNVHAYAGEEHFEAALLTGNIQVQNILNPDNIIELKPNELVSLVDGKLKLSTIQNRDYFSWRKGILCFNEPLCDVFEKLELYFDVQIDSKQIKKQNISNLCVAKFRSRDGINHILRVLQLSHQFRYKTDSENNKITIY